MAPKMYPTVEDIVRPAIQHIITIALHYFNSLTAEDITTTFHAAISYALGRGLKSTVTILSLVGWIILPRVGGSL
jgi:hypothetical protein